jgi:RHS repeat-associated protein
VKKTGTLDQPYQFSTKAYDRGTGLSYYGYRFYSPSMGRWTSRDPLGEKGGLNLYEFVGNDPVNRIDLLGEVWWNPWTWFDDDAPDPCAGEFSPKTHNRKKICDFGSNWDKKTKDPDNKKCGMCVPN